MTKTFYRVANQETKQGLWYDQAGQFTGLIHNQLNFCKHSALQMPWDGEIRGWLSATETLEELYEWFPQADILKLQEHGYFIYEYTATDYRRHTNHWLVGQESSIVGKKIILYTSYEQRVRLRAEELAEAHFVEIHKEAGYTTSFSERGGSAKEFLIKMMLPAARLSVKREAEAVKEAWQESRLCDYKNKHGQLQDGEYAYEDVSQYLQSLGLVPQNNEK